MYFYKSGNFRYSKSDLNDDYTRIEFKSPINTFNENNDTVHCTLKKARKVDSAVIIIHGLGMSRKWDRYMKFIPEDTAACSIDLPHQRRRKSDVSLISSFHDGIFSLNFFRQGTMDIMRTIDILKHMGYREINLIGISLGSIFSIISMALDERVNKSILLLSGGDQGIITWKSPALFKVRREHIREGITREKCIKNRSFIDDFLKSVKKGHKPHEIKSDVICFYFDPVSFAPLINPEKVLMINAIFDIIIPRESTRRLHNALGKPKIIWIPAGHLTLHLFRNKIISFIKSFLKYY